MKFVFNAILLLVSIALMAVALAPILRTLLEGLLASFSSTAGQALYLNDLFSFFEVEPEILLPENPLPFPQPIAQGFVFEDVGFMYPGAERWAVRGLSFALKAGEDSGSETVLFRGYPFQTCHTDLCRLPQSRS